MVPGWISNSIPKTCLYIRIDRRRKLPATILLRALGYTAQEILEIFFENDVFHLSTREIKMDLVPQRLRGQQVQFDITTGKGEVIVEAGKRITARHIRELEKSRIKRLAVPATYITGRALAKDIIDPETGELLVEANTVITEELIEQLIEKKFKTLETIYTNDLDQRPVRLRHLAHRHHQYNELEGQVEIYRMMRPGEPPTKEAAHALFNNLFFNADRYDLSAVGRMKFNRRLNAKAMKATGH